MKKTLAIVLCLLLSLCVLSACGDEPAVDPANPGTNVEGNAAEEGEEAHVLTDSAGYTIEAEVASQGKIMVDGKVYIESNVTIPDYVGEPDQMRSVESFVDLSETPSENGQTNFDAIGAPYILYGEGVVMFLDDLWIYFMPME
ncbi:MAG: hypothetical protein IJP07_04920 [Firmicutes bacterium]|nr:hypothetical protein [Bacillota bacterium]